MKNIIFSIIILCATMLALQAQISSTATHHYDELNRLFKIEYSDGTVIEFVFDELGNRETLIRTGSNSDTADLQVNNLALTSNTIGVGSSFSFSFSEENTSTASASGHHIGVYLSDDAEWDANDNLLQSQFVAYLDGNDNQSFTLNLTIPNTQATGDYHLIVRADDNSIITENDETNNDEPIAVTLVNCSSITFNIDSQTNETCENGNGSAAISVSGGAGNTSITWSDGQLGTTASNLSAGIYTVIATDENNCQASTTITIDNVGSSTVASFNLAINGLEVNALNYSSNATGSTWAWGDNNSDTDFQPSHSYATGGTYTVCLTTTGSCDSDTFCQSVFISNDDCPAPNNLLASNIDTNSAEISWSVLPSVDSYTLQYRNVGSSNWSNFNEINTNNYTLAGLELGTAYEIQVISSCGSSNSVASESYYFVTSGAEDGGGNTSEGFYLTLGVENYDSYTCLSTLTSDGYIIGAGYSVVESTQSFYFKSDLDGNIQWFKKFHNVSTASDYPIAVESDNNGGFLMNFVRDNFTNNEEGAIELIQFDSNGNLSLQNYYQETDTNRDLYAFKTIPTSDGGFVTICKNDASNDVNEGINITKTNSSGTVQWTKTHVTSEQILSVFKVRETSDNGFLIGGYYTTDGTFNARNMLLLKLTSNGTFSWSKEIDVANDRDEVRDFQQLSDGGYILLCQVKNTDGATAPYLIKLSSTGTVVWSKEYIQMGEDNYPNSLLLDNDENLIVGCGSLLFKTNNSGEVLWARDFSAPGFSNNNAYHILDNGDIIATGSTSNGASTSYDYHVIRLNAYGSACNVISNLTLNVTDVSLSSSSFAFGSNYSPTLTNNNTSILNPLDHAYSENSNCQEVVDTFFKEYDHSSNFYLSFVSQLNDGGYLLASNGASSLIQYMKTDINGTLLWSKDYSIPAFKSLQWAEATSDGGAILSGYGDSVSGSINNVTVLKIDKDGNREWLKQYGHSTLDRANKIHQTSDGGYILAGWRQSSEQDGIVIKLDPNGIVTWKRYYGSTSYDEVFDDVQETDDGYVAIGRILGTTSADDVLLIKMNNSGVPIWTKVLNGNDTENDFGTYIEVLNDGDYLLHISSNSFGSQDVESIFTKVNSSNGDVIWANYYGIEKLNTVLELANGDLMLASDGRLVRTNNNGMPIWAKHYSQSHDFTTYNFIQTQDGGFAMTGRYNNNYILLKTEEDGNTVDCANHDIILSPTSVNWSISSPSLASGDYTNLSTNTHSTNPNTGTITESTICSSCNVIAEIAVDNSNICEGENIQFFFTGSGASTFDWKIDGTTFANTANASYNFSTAGTHIIEVTASTGEDCEDSQSITVTVNSTPNININITDETCSATNGTATATIGGGAVGEIIHWSTGETGTSISGLSAGTYTATAIDQNDCSVTASFTILDDLSDCTADIKLGQALTFSMPIMEVDNNFMFGGMVINEGGLNWDGELWLQINNASLISLGQFTIPSNGQVNLNYSYVPETAHIGVNVEVKLLYQTEGNNEQTLVPPASYSNPIAVTIADTYEGCASVLYSNGTLTGISNAVMFDGAITFIVGKEPQDNFPGYPSPASKFVQLDLESENGNLLTLEANSAAAYLSHSNLALKPNGDVSLIYQAPTGNSYGFQAPYKVYDGEDLLTDELVYANANWGAWNRHFEGSDGVTKLTSFASAGYYHKYFTRENNVWTAYNVFGPSYYMYNLQATGDANDDMHISGRYGLSSETNTLRYHKISGLSLSSETVVDEEIHNNCDIEINSIGIVSLLYTQDDELKLAQKIEGAWVYETIVAEVGISHRASIFFREDDTPVVTYSTNEKLVVLEKQDETWVNVYEHNNLVYSTFMASGRAPSLLMKEEDLHVVYNDGLRVYTYNIETNPTLPVADFTYTADGYYVTFSDNSTNGSSQLWDFGDGTGSSLESPSYTFPNEGVFEVCLTILNDCGSDEKCISITIEDDGCNPCTICGNLNDLFAYFPFNQNSNDESGNNYDGILNGPTLTTDRLGNPNSAFIFDGISDKIVVPNPFGNSVDENTDIGIGFWFQTTSNKESGTIMSFNTACSGGAQDDLVSVNFNGGTQEKLSVSIMGLPAMQYFSEDLNDGNWHHVVLSYANDSSQLYVDGIKVVEQTGNANINFNPNIDLIIGDYYTNACGTDSHFDGKIDDIRLFNKSLTSVEVAELFSENNAEYAPIADFDVELSLTTLGFAFDNRSQNAVSHIWDFGDGLTSTDENPVHFYQFPGDYTVTLTTTNDCGSHVFSKEITVHCNSCDFCQDVSSLSAHFSMDGDLTDNSDNVNPGTIEAELTENRFGEIEKALFFDGNNDGGHIQYNFFDTTKVSIAFWARIEFPMANDGQVHYFFDSDTQRYLLYETGSGNLTVVAAGVNMGSITEQPDWWVQNEWLHFVLVFNATEEYTELWINGQLEHTFITDWVAHPTDNFYIGRRFEAASQGSTEAFKGSLDEFRIYRKKLSSDEINVLYLEGTGFDAPIADFTSTSNNLEISIIDDSENAQNRHYDFGDGTTSTESNPQHTYASAGTYTVIQTVSSSCGIDTKEISITVEGTATGISISNLKVFLEGPYDADTQSMRTDLVAGNHLPDTSLISPTVLLQVVDWMDVELRAETDSTLIIDTLQAVLLENGSLADVNGNTTLQFSNAVAGNYYVVLKHRNHLDVMTASAIPLGNGLTTSLDFTDAILNVFGGNLAMKNINGKKVLYAGDASGDNQISSSDKNNFWLPQSGTSGYKSADFNLSGQTSASDKNLLWLPNSGKGSQVPPASE